MERRNSKRENFEKINLVELWQVCVSDISFIRNVTAICTVLALAYVFFVPPTYQSIATVRIKPQKGIGASILDSGAAGNTNRQQVNTYMHIIKSPEVVAPVIMKLDGVDKDKAFDRALGYAGNITTTVLRDTELVQVAVRSKDPAYAHKANAALMESFLQYLTDIERQQYAITRDFLEGRVVEAKKDLNKAEDILGEYQREHGIVSNDNAVQLAADRLAMTDKLKAENRINLEVANAQMAAANSQMHNGDASIVDSPTLQAYNAKLAELEKDRLQYAAKFKEKHPAVIKVNQDIAALKQKINEEIQRITSQQTASSGIYNNILANKYKSEADASVATQNLQSLNTIENDFKQDINRLTDEGKECLRLMRDVNIAQEIYAMLAKRLEEAKVAEYSVTRDVQIVGNPILPKHPIAPNKSKTVGLAFIMSLLGSSLFVIAKEMLNKTIRTADDIKKYGDIPVLGQIPSLESLNKAKNGTKLNVVDKIGGALWKK